jgi:hypothetical protein
MENYMKLKFYILAFLLSLSPFTHSQSSSGLLAPNRSIDWSSAGAGVIPARTTICATLSSGASMASVQSAIASCPAGQTVLLGSGTYSTASSLILTTSNVTLRGAGPKLTKLVFTGTSTNCLGIGPVAMCLYNGDSGAIGFAANVLTVSSGMTQGSTSVVLGSAPVFNICGSGSSACSGSISNLHIGSLISFNQLDDSTDTGNAFFNGSTTYSQQGDNGNVFPGRSQIQVVTVTGISGSTVTFTPALYAPNWSSGKSPLATFSSSPPLTGFGLENLTVDTQAVTGSTSDAAMIQFIWATNSWIKNVAMVNATTTSTAMHKHVWVAASSHITIRDSYEYGSSPSSEAYGMDFWQSGDSLAENNICQKVATCEIMEGGTGNVFGYNYAVDNYYDNGDPQWQQCDQFHHNAGDYYNLWEGNIGTCHTEDSIHGTAFANTIFRNALSGFDPSTSTAAKTQNLLTTNSMGYSRYLNYVMNVLGYGGHAATYNYAMTSTTDCGIGNSGMVFLLGDTGQIGSEYSSTCYGGTLSPPGPVPNDIVANAGPAFSSMICGNWDAVTSGIHTCQTASSASTYPGLASPSTSYASYPSLYLSAKPSWWIFPSGSTAPWPAIGPEVIGGNIASTGGHAWITPANNCYKNILGGLTDGSSTALAFDASTCYIGTPTAQVASPIFSPIADTYTSTLPITASSSTSAATICYTTDGSTPTTNGAGVCTHGSTYTAGVVISSTSTLKAIGTKSGYLDSNITSGTYTLTGAPSIIFTATMTSNSSSTGIVAAPSRKQLGNVGIGCSGGVITPIGYQIGQLYATSSIASAAVAAGCPSQGVVTTTSSGIGIQSMNNGYNAGGTDSPVTVTDTYGGSTYDSVCTGDTHNSLATPISGLAPITCVPNSSGVFAESTASGHGNSDVLWPSDYASNSTTLDNALYYYRDMYWCTDNVSTLHDWEFDVNINSSPTSYSAGTGAYTGWGEDWGVNSQMFRAAPQGGGWTILKGIDVAGVHAPLTSYPLTTGHCYKTRQFGHRRAACTASNSSNCFFYDYLTVYDVTSGESPTTYALVSASTGLPVGGIPVNHSLWASGPDMQVQIDMTSASASSQVRVISDTTEFYGVSTSTAATPTFSPIGGTYSSAQTVSLADSTPSSTIFYTTDGSTPTTSSLLYTTPFTVSTTTTVNAIATAPGFIQSVVGTALYTISSSPAATPTLTPTAGTYSGTQTVAISTTTPSATIHYTTDGTTPTTSSPVYTSALTVSASTTVKAVAIASGFSLSSVGVASYLISPSGSPIPPASFNGTISCVLVPSTPGAKSYKLVGSGFFTLSN